jgi:hypothetical protein
MAKIKLDISHQTVPQFIAYLQAILANITGNATFTTLAAKITALNTATTALDDANTDYDAAVEATKSKLTLRNDKRTAAENALRVVANGAEELTTNAAQLESAGFALQSAGSPVGTLGQPQNLHASGGDLDGEVDVQWDSLPRGVQSYIAEHSTSVDGPWTQFYVGKASKATATGLTSGTEYWFRVRAVGAAGPSQWSDKASKRAT